MLEHIRLSLNGKHYKQCWMTYNFSTMWATGKFTSMAITVLPI